MVKWCLSWKRASDGGWTLELSRSVPPPPWVPVVELLQVAVMRLVDARTGGAPAVAPPPVSRDSAAVN